ncbi:molybdopterin adenylyltransferase [Roseimaritima sediminicola]|uniref:molybdopterin adenylyltransferase n=1 Tax=Roseimaritima sediminicola TaxID=2662066 RepID=UPI0012983AB5|nr:molybdopterin adenylyltransferase [Roseimaritima sediminicola]
MKPLKIGILTASDRATRGQYEDRSGPAIVDYLAEVVVSPYQTVSRCVEDRLETLVETLVTLVDEEGCGLVITTGGTGPTPRDVTPEATEAVCDKMLPGFGEQMRRVSLQYVPTAILSRQTAGLRGRTLVVNLPGQPRAIAQCLDAVFPAIPACLKLIDSDEIRTNTSRFVAHPTK